MILHKEALRREDGSRDLRKERAIELDICTYRIFTLLLMLLLVINAFSIYILLRHYNWKSSKATT